MRLSRLLLASTGFALLATPAQADPISLTIFGVTMTINVAAIAVSMALNVAAGLLMKGRKAKSKEQARKLNEVDASPIHRYAYGTLRLGGYVIGREIVGRNLYLGILLQHRPSAGPFTLQLDGREAPLQGASHDFSGPGAETYAPEGASEDTRRLAGHVQVWIGLGDQTTIPALILSECPRMSQAEAWPGCTVVWIKARLGGRGSASERWPNGMPNVTLTGRWSRLYDPRKPGHDLDNPLTWEWSDNQALVVLDMALHRDCLAIRPDRLLMSSFADGADICDEPIPLKAGGFEPRYRVAGVWEADGGSPYDFIQPALRAGMSDLQEVTQGDRKRFVYIPGKFTPPTLTLSDADIAEGDISISTPDPGDMFNAALVNFLAPMRNWEMTPIPEIVVSAALEEDSAGGDERKSTLDEDLDWVPSPGQAARIGRRSILLSRPPRIIEASFLRPAIFAHASAVVRLESATRPYLDGVFSVSSWRLSLPAVDEALGLYRIETHLALREIGPDVDIWDPADEPEIEAAPPPYERRALGAPRDMEIVAEMVDLGGGVEALGARVSFLPPHNEAAATGYVLRWRLGADGEWRGGVSVPWDQKDPLDRVYAFAAPILAGRLYEYEVATQGTGIGWDVLVRTLRTTATLTTPTPPPSPPQALEAQGIGGLPAESGVETRWRLPDEEGVLRLVIYRGATAVFSAAEEIASVRLLPGEYAEIFDPIPNVGDTRRYWACSLDRWGRLSDPAGPLTATVPP